MDRSAISGIALTLLIFALTLQNFFIFRAFLQRVGLNSPSAASSLSGFTFPQLNPINYNNSLQNGYDLPSASLLDAVGATLAIYAGYAAVVGRVGIGEVFFLSCIGTFLYEVNELILWRLYIPDNGYPSRAFAFGGAMGIVSSLLLGKRDLTHTQKRKNYRSNYRPMAMAYLGTVMVWCTYPVLVLANLYTSTTGKITAAAGQTNIWLALSSGVLGTFAASSIYYRKLNLHDFVFTSLAGAITLSSTTDVYYSPGAASGIGFLASFVTSFIHTSFKQRLNKNGVVDSNSSIFAFFFPSLLAAAVSAIFQSIGLSGAAAISHQSYNSATELFISNNYVAQGENVAEGRGAPLQGAYQFIGWGISVGVGIGAGLVVGLIYRLINDTFTDPLDFFNDATIFDLGVKDQEQEKQQ